MIYFHRETQYKRLGKVCNKVEDMIVSHNSCIFYLFKKKFLEFVVVDPFLSFFVFSIFMKI